MIKKLIRLIFNYELIKTKKAPNIDSLLRVILKNNITCVFDVGANIGQFLKKIRELGYNKKIYAFEPVSANFKELKKIKDNNLEIFNFGFGDKTEKIKINVTAGSDLSSILEPNEIGEKILGNKINVQKQETVSIKKFDSFFNLKSHSNNLLKIDTQGYDLNVLTGASSSLKYIDYILVETSFISIYKDAPGFCKINKFLNDNKFFLTHIYPLSRNKNGNIVECDCLYKNSRDD